MRTITLLFFCIFPFVSIGDGTNLNSTNIDTCIVECCANGDEIIVEPSVSVTNDIPEESPDYFGAIMPLITLIVGFILNKWYESYIRKKRLKEEGTEWVQSFVQLKDPLEKQVKDLEEYIPINDENVFEINDLPFQMYLKCEMFKGLNEKSLVPFLSSGNNKLSYREAVVVAGKLQGTVELLEYGSKRFFQTFETFKSETSNYISLFNSVFNEFKIKVAEYHDYAISKYPSGSEQLTEALKMQELMVEHVFPHQDSGEFNLFELGERFVKPFFDTTYVDRDNRIVREIIKQLNLCDRYIKATKMEKKYFRIKLEKELKAYQKRLEEVNKLLEQKKLIEE